VSAALKQDSQWTVDACGRIESKRKYYCDAFSAIMQKHYFNENQSN